MARCEDYPCCGHGPPPLGDGGGCPSTNATGQEIWPCAQCGGWMEPGYTSAICEGCKQRIRECAQYDCPGCRNCTGEEDMY
jgi:hypothetical protein